MGRLGRGAASRVGPRAVTGRATDLARPAVRRAAWGRRRGARAEARAR